ncbi:ORC-CDC6 family AAA ATPase, partial [Enterococcus lactis]|uniref:ORC-CDC6 family AAA ATPase n=1 Tax=Enterococcus lactis TaxID=357441 RepID=UPI003DA438CF
IDTYKNNAIFTDEMFEPEKVLSIYEISSIVINIIKANESNWEKVNFLLLIDEFENLDFELQKMFNSLIKFTRNDISLRVGRRSEGVVTKKTINDTEYLRENHDYRLISLSKESSIKEIKSYFIEIAKKRFKIYEEFCEEDVSTIFGPAENLDWEAKIISNGKKDHIYNILSTSKEIAEDKDLLYRIANIIEYEENPIAEMLNALWVIRSKEDKIEAAKSTIEIMKLAFDKSNSQNEKVKKYKTDYNNKYRYSLVGLMCSIYKKPKMYYSLNTICHLSNSNARMFINFCRAIINDALFYEREQFLLSKKVSEHTQSKAIHEVSQDEFKNVCSIIQHGNKIRNLVQNLGNVFLDFSRDRKVRYPETNQFVFNYEEIDSECKKIIDMAENWAVILKRKKPQRISVGNARRGYIYYINRSYAPIFNISYRTRGGYNVPFTAEEMEEMCRGQAIIYKIDRNRDKNAAKKEYEQISLFDFFETRETDE